MASPPTSRAGWIARASLLVALVGALTMLFAPFGRVESSGSAGVRTVSLVEFEGWWVAWIAVVPVAVAGLPVLLERTKLRRVARIVAASLLAAGVVVEAVSIGLFFLPAAIAMIVASVPRDSGDVRKAPLSSPAG